MAQDFARFQRGYANLWSRARLLAATRQQTLDTARDQWLPGMREHYNTAAAMTGVPAAIIAALNYRESGGRLDRYLGNGDRLDRPTTHVPAGHGPFASWEQGAADALKNTERPSDGRWTYEFALYFAENFNGRGYQTHNENSPYIWSQTNLEQRGLFIGDHDFDVNAWDTRPGIAALLLAFQTVAPSLSLATVATTQEPPMPTTTTAPASDPFPAIIKGLDLLKNGLPFFGGFLPPPAGPILQIAVPALEDLIEFVEQARTSGVAQTDVAALFDKLQQHVANIAASLKK